MLSIADALDDPALFGPWFLGPSWDTWRAILKAAFALPMSDRELEIFRSVAERDPPKKRVRELWIIGGRRGGKDSIASLIATWFPAFESYEGRLRPGETATVLCLAVDRDQARIVLNYTKAYFERIDMLRGLVTRETMNGLDIGDDVELNVLASNFRSVRGRSIACAILDEVAFWRDESSASPDIETYNALVPGLATIPGSMLVGISSPYRRGGLLYQKWKSHYGKDDDDVLVVVASSRTLNPTLDQKLVDDAMARDPAVARAEWLAEWRDDVSTFLPREIIDASVDIGVIVRPPIPGVSYKAFADPSGGVGDAFTCAIAHSEGDEAILDCLVEILPPFDPATATETIAKVLKSYRCNEVTGDRYSAGWVVGAVARLGLSYRHSERDRSAIYTDALPLFTSGRARLLDNAKLVAQFANLERRTSSGGRDRIDHPRGARDDSSNAAAGALVLTSIVAPGDGWIRYYEQLLGLDASNQKGPLIKLRAPAGISHVRTYSGKELVVPKDSVIEVSEEDARPLVGAGFERLTPEAPRW